MTVRARPLLASLTAARQAGKLDLERPGDRTPETWFIGPKGENADLLRRLVLRAIAANADARRDYMPDDPRIYGADRAPEIARSEAFITERLDEVLHSLRGSIPLSSFRNLSHMYWDQSLPAIVGYIAALFYNQNNVAAEASPATTLMEIEVGDDLCRMLGYTIPDTDQVAGGAIKPWGHITCDGSVANAESVWASRNLKLLGPALAAAVRQDPTLAAAQNVTVRLLGGGRARLLELRPWELANLPIDEVLGLAGRLSTVSGIDPATVEAALGRVSVQALGLVAFHRTIIGDMPTPVLMAPATAHYSWPKSMALLGLGTESRVVIPVDADGRMLMPALRAALDRCLDEGRPVMQVTAVIGSTEESAVDPLADIVAIRDEYRAMGLEFSIHADAAWGGYFAALLRQPKDRGPLPDDPGEDDPWRTLLLGDGSRAPGMLFSPYVMRQFQALAHADTVTVDPHKAGFIPYPAGALCYRNGAMRDTISFKAPVVYHGGVDPTVGVYGIEGSKPGAAASAVYLSHSVIRPDRSGYGDLLGRCIFNSKRFYAALVGLRGPDFTVTPFQRLPSERVPGATPADVAAEKRRIADKIASLRDTDLVSALLEDRDVYGLFRSIGPDLTITTYAFNLVTAEGVNRDPLLMNEMNNLVYSRLSLQAFNGGVIPTIPMFVTSSTFDTETYGADFVADFARRAGCTPVPGLAMNFLISTTQNPWLTEGGAADILETIMGVLSDTASAAAQKVMERHGIGPPA